MKHDPYFKYLAAVVIAGVVIALFEPTPTEEIAPHAAATIAASR
jgi:hypothetical protein